MHSLRQKTGRHKLTDLQSKYDRARKSRQQTQPSHTRRSVFPEEEFKDREDDGEYDSTDSLDQLLDENFTPCRSRQNGSRKRITNPTSKKSVRMTAGGKRAKAMALMAAKNKQSHRKPSAFGRDRQEIHEQNKRQFKSIQDNLCTPSIASRSSFKTLKQSRRVLSPTPYPSRTATPLFRPNGNNGNSASNATFDQSVPETPAFTTLKRSRRVISPTPNPSRVNSPKSKPTQRVLLLETPKPSKGDFQVTPKRKKNALNEVGTPLTPTPTKLFKTLNIKTPETEIKKSLFASKRDTEHDRIRTELESERKEPESRPRSLIFENDGRNRKDSRKVVEDRLREYRKQRVDRKEERKVADRLRSWQDIEVTPKKDKAASSHSKESGVSAFDQLLKATQALPLPLKWTILIQKFNALESTLALYQRKSMFYVQHHSIAHSVRQICKKTFAQRDLQEIVSIVPDFYHLQWTPYVDKVTQKKDMRLTLTAMNYDPYSDQQIEDPFHKNEEDENEENEPTKKGNEEQERMNQIGIRFLKVCKLKERERVFRVRLVQYLAFHHRQFLIENVLVEFDPLETGKWHRKFDLENVADIEISPLPKRERKGMDEIEKMMMAQKKKLEDIAQRELERAKQEEELKNDPMMGKAMVIPKHLSHLSPTMVARIRAKEKGKTVVTTKSLSSAKEKTLDDKQYRLQQLPYLVTLLRGIYVSSRKSRMKCDDLIAVIKKRHRNKHILGQEIWSQLQILSDLKSKFFMIRQGSMVKVAKMDKSVSTKQVLDEIQRKIKKAQK